MTEKQKIFDIKNIHELETLVEVKISDPRFLCGQCQNLLFNPKTCNKCNKSICSECYQSNDPKCKSCHSILDETDSFIKNSLLILPIKCPNKCEEKITFSSLEFHLQKCIKKPEPCYVKTCQFIGTKKEWNEHINNDSHTNPSIFECQKCTVVYLGNERHDCIKNLKGLIKSQKNEIQMITKQLQAAKVIIYSLNKSIEELEKNAKDGEKDEDKIDDSKTKDLEISLTCNLHHELKWIRAIRLSKCQKCDANNVIARYICEQCELYYCQKCTPPQFTNKQECPGGHNLKYEQKPGPNLQCDFCFKYPYEMKVSILSDRECDFDICFTCFKKKK